MATLVSISTCARPGCVDYLQSTAAVLYDAGARDCAYRYVVCDGAGVAAPPEWRLAAHDRPREGVRLTMWRAFGLAAELDVDKLIYCEDDIVPCGNAIRVIDAMSIPSEAAFIDFHDVRFYRRTWKAGLHIRALGSSRYPYWGNQCMAFPRRTVDWLLTQDPMTILQRPPPNCADEVLGILLANSPWPRYAIHMPCLVRHVGAVSAAHPGKQLRTNRLPSQYWGDDFDARALSSHY